MGKLSKRKTTMLILAILFVGLCAFALATKNVAFADETEIFAGGTGTKDDPYIIETSMQLNAVRNNLSASYKLNADIVFTEDDFAEGGEFYNEGKGWEPIGTYSAAFKGTFDGNGRIIKNLKSNQKGNPSALFGLSKGSIMRLGMIDCNIVSDGYAAGICAGNDGKINECYVTGSIKSTGSGSGGIVGYSQGMDYENEITNCYSGGKVSGSHAGGIVGAAGPYRRSVCIEYCYSTATVVGLVRGSIVGSATGSDWGQVEVSGAYSIGYCEEVVGRVNDKRQVRMDCCNVKTVDDLRKQDTYVGFNFDKTWKMDPNADYWLPTLRNVPNYAIAPYKNTTDYEDGYGTFDSPYLIRTSEQLDNIKKSLGAVYKLECDIVFDKTEFSKNGNFYNGGKRWKPIGTKEEPFSGSLDGNGYCISGLIIDRADESGCGLFGSNVGNITNLEIENFKIKGYDICGGIAGYNYGKIENSYNLTTVDGYEAKSYGVLCGKNYGTISGCFNTGDVTASVGGAAGIAGYNDSQKEYYGLIEKCYNSGKIISNSANVGGIVLVNDSDNAKIKNCYNTGNILAGGFAGGIAAENHGGYGSNNYSILNCYNIGIVRAKGSTYGISPWFDNKYFAYIKDCYSLDTSDECGEGYGTVCTLKTMMKKDTYSGFDFDAVWDFDDESDYKFPTLRNVKNYAIAPTENKTDFAGGYGTKSSPYIIKTKEHLNNVRNSLNSYFKLISDIIFEESDFEEGGAFYNDGRGWKPIGDSDENFWGYFDGRGHAISGLYCDNSDEEYVGLFGYTNGSIKNLKMTNVSIKGTKYIGAIAGYMRNCSISNCDVEGTIDVCLGKNSNKYVGGIVGYANGGKITDCTNNCTIQNECTLTLGGIIGYAGVENGNFCTIINCENYKKLSAGYGKVGGILGDSESYIKIIQCQNYGMVQSGDTAGGIAGSFGRRAASNAVIDGCFNTGDIFANYAGGIAGSGCGTVRNSYNAGKIVGTERSYAVAGIMGNCSANAIIEYCYNIGNAYADNGCAGGILGNGGYGNESQIKSCYNIGNISCDSGNTGAILGKGSVTIANCFYLDNVSKGVGSGTDTATQCTAEQLQNAETYGTAFDFDYDMIWSISDTAEYKFPILTEVVNPELQYTLSAGARQGMAETPTAESYGNGKITVKAISGQKYVCVQDTDKGNSGEIPAFSSSEWKSASGSTLVFSGLTQGKTYRVYTYIPAVGGQSASYISQPLVVTLKAVGDLGGDGKIDSSDALYLRRAIAGWDGYELNFSAADINADEKLTADDIMYLERHIAGWKGYETLPVQNQIS